MKELRSMVIGEMTEKVRLLLSVQESGCLQWGGTRMDLLELLHEVYYNCGIRLEDGSYATFSYLVEHVYRVFGMVPPRNPCAKALRAEGRKGIRRASFVSRMEGVLASADGEAGLARFWDRFIMGDRDNIDITDSTDNIDPSILTQLT